LLFSNAFNKSSITRYAFITNSALVKLALNDKNFTTPHSFEKFTALKTLPNDVIVSSVSFVIMFITGILLVYAKPVETVQSLWFRIKMILLVAAFINAMIFNAKLKAADGSWDMDRVAPKNLRIGAIISLVLWMGVVAMGRYIPYDWVDCANTDNRTILWAAGCVEQLKAL
jgi:hypothetical protein